MHKDILKEKFNQKLPPSKMQDTSKNLRIPIKMVRFIYERKQQKKCTLDNRFFLHHFLHVRSKQGVKGRGNNFKAVI